MEGKDNSGSQNYDLRIKNFGINDKTNRKANQERG